MIFCNFKNRKLSRNFLMTKFMVILSWYQIICKYYEVMLCQLKQQNFMGTNNSSDFLVINGSLLITKKAVVSTTDRLTSTEDVFSFSNCKVQCLYMRSGSGLLSLLSCLLFFVAGWNPVDRYKWQISVCKTKLVTNMQHTNYYKRDASTA